MSDELVLPRTLVSTGFSTNTEEKKLVERRRSSYLKQAQESDKANIATTGAIVKQT